MGTIPIYWGEQAAFGRSAAQPAARSVS